MKKCPFCAEDIQDAAKVCKHCGLDLENPTAAAQQVQAVQPKKTGCLAWAVAILLGLIFMGWCSSQFGSSTPSSSSSGTQPAPSAPRRTPTPRADQLELLSSRGYESEGGGYHIVEGEVKNISGERLESIQAVSTWYGSDGTMITSDDALVEFNPLMPGQTSPFKTMSRTNPLMTKYVVTFKKFFGAEIPTKDSRKK